MCLKLTVCYTCNLIGYYDHGDLVVEPLEGHLGQVLGTVCFV